MARYTCWRTAWRSSCAKTWAGYRTPSGSARNWDVSRFETLAPLMHRLPQEKNLTRLDQAGERMRQEGYVLVDEALRRHRYAILLLRLELWLINGAWKSVNRAQPRRRPRDRIFGAGRCREGVGKARPPDLEEG
ncbi:MAG: CHAD domain-containing protein [Rhodospirillales bacterium]|nr:CHAD domain-containing protein [Rhodospirillales bacterium]